MDSLNCMGSSHNISKKYYKMLSNVIHFLYVIQTVYGNCFTKIKGGTTAQGGNYMVGGGVYKHTK